MDVYTERIRKTRESAKKWKYGEKRIRKIRKLKEVRRREKLL